MLAITSPKLAGLALFGIPLIVLPIALSGRRVRGAAKDSQDRVADANARAGETFNAMHTVQSYAREPFERERFSVRCSARWPPRASASACRACSRPA
jgi:ATP-binding cassette subfamily B protein